MISVVTPVFNGERFIEKCINVVIDQACPDVEHIIVDGASNDGTVAIIESYASRYRHMRWISEKDDGQSDALNKGIGLARGTILGVLNVDDYYEENVLNRVSAIFETLSEPTVVVGNCNVWDDNGNLLYVNKPSRLGITDLLAGWDFAPHPVNPSAYFYHRSLHDIIGFYRQDVVGQDLPFILSAAQAAQMKYVDEVWGNWRKLKDTLTVRGLETGLAQQQYLAVMSSFCKQLSPVRRLEVFIKRHRTTRLLRGIIMQILRTDVASW